MTEDTIVSLHKELQSGSKVLIEGANAAMLDIDFGNSDVVCYFLVFLFLTTF